MGEEAGLDRDPEDNQGYIGKAKKTFGAEKLSQERGKDPKKSSHPFAWARKKAGGGDGDGEADDSGGKGFKKGRKGSGKSGGKKGGKKGSEDDFLTGGGKGKGKGKKGKGQDGPAAG